MLPPTVPMVLVCFVHMSRAVYPRTSIRGFISAALSSASSEAIAPIRTSWPRFSIPPRSGTQFRSMQ